MNLYYIYIYMQTLPLPYHLRMNEYINSFVHEWINVHMHAALVALCCTMAAWWQRWCSGMQCAHAHLKRPIKKERKKNKYVTISYSSGRQKDYNIAYIYIYICRKKNHHWKCGDSTPRQQIMFPVHNLITGTARVGVNEIDCPLHHALYTENANWNNV